jgi:putative transcriptional regulator
MSPLQGHFLVAAPHQADRNLVETVVLVVEHTDRGAFGVVMNCPREPSGDTPSRHDYTADTATYFGGPVIGPFMALHAQKYLAEVEIVPGVFFSAKEDNVLPLMEQTDQPYKIFTGYVEWGKGQLDEEVEQGIWRIVPATADQVFSDSKNLWERLSKQAFPLQLHDLFDPNHVSVNPQFN